MENNQQNTLIGPYYFGIVKANVPIPSSDTIKIGHEKAKDLGNHTMRIYLGPEFDQKYRRGEYSEIKTPERSLTELAKRPEIDAILGDKQFDVIVITCYDYASLPGLSSWGKEYKKFLQPEWFGNLNNENAVIDEWIDFSRHLCKTYPKKKFILSTWEGDNQCYEKGAWHAEITEESNNNVRGYAKWIRARTIGIRKANTTNCYSSVEMTSLRYIHGKKGLDVLHYVVKEVPDLDYLSYSMWESKKGDKFAEDIDYIRNTLNMNLNPKKPILFIGEVGYSSYERESGLVKNPDINYAAAKLATFLDVIQQKKIPYALVWNLFPMNDGKGENDYGAIDMDGKISPYGRVFQNK